MSGTGTFLYPVLLVLNVISFMTRILKKALCFVFTLQKLSFYSFSSILSIWHFCGPAGSLGMQTGQRICVKTTTPLKLHYISYLEFYVSGLQLLALILDVLPQVYHGGFGKVLGFLFLTASNAIWITCCLNNEKDTVKIWTLFVGYQTKSSWKI